jgi:preprotein translocase subunit SecF
MAPGQTAGQKNLLLIIRADASLIATKEAQANLYNEIRQEGGDFKVVEESEVGALMGRELTNKAIWGVIIGNFLILLYITFRLSFDFAVFAIVALIHDILVVLGVFALFNMEVNSSFVAIILTVVGYSVNDTIIIYDRIRENMTIKRHLPFDKLVNVSLNETLARSINTTLTTVLAITALLVFGGASIRTFMIGLAVGISTGAYSSIFIAAMMIVSWRLRGKGSVIIEERPKPVMAPSAGPIRVDRVERPEEEAEEEEAGQVEMIQVGQGSPKPKTGKRPKRRRRR